MERNTKRTKKFMFLTFLFLVIIGGVILLWGIFLDGPNQDWDDELSQENIGQITYQGKQYSYNESVINILFMGIDNSSGIQDDNTPSDAGQADCLMLLSLNTQTKKATVLQIPRDTMTDVDLYNEHGEYISTVQEQIATQYAYSTGGKNSCWATKKTVSELLYELPIDGYLAMAYTSIAPVNDALGGVEITFPRDYTHVDPVFKEGVTLKLTGQQAHDYVRYRDINVDFSNNDRMQRQVHFIPALINTIKKNMETKENYKSELYPLIRQHMVTDLQEGEFLALLEYELPTSEIIILPGEGKKGEVYEEFYVDQEKLQKILIEMFYILEE